MLGKGSIRAVVQLVVLMSTFILPAHAFVPSVTPLLASKILPTCCFSVRPHSCASMAASDGNAAERLRVLYDASDAVISATADTMSQGRRPAENDVTEALVWAKDATIPTKSMPDGRWRAVFSASAEALTRVIRDSGEGEAEGGASGRYLPMVSYQTWTPDNDDKTSGVFANELQIGPGAFSVTFGGTYTAQGRVQTLAFSSAEVRFQSLSPDPVLRLNISEGSLARNIVERFARGGAKTKDGSFRKRPNKYAWWFVDDKVCVASGSSGAIALWGKADDENQ